MEQIPCERLIVKTNLFIENRGSVPKAMEKQTF